MRSFTQWHIDLQIAAHMRMGTHALRCAERERNFPFVRKQWLGYATDDALIIMALEELGGVA